MASCHRLAARLHRSSRTTLRTDVAVRSDCKIASVNTASTSDQPRVANIRLHPIKSLDPVYVNESRIGPAGGLELDRAWALYTPDNRWVNGKRTSAIFPIRAEFTSDLKSVTLSVPGDRREIHSRTFAFPGDTEEAAEWFSVYFEQRIIVRYSAN